MRLRDNTTNTAAMTAARTLEMPMTIMKAFGVCWNGSGMFIP